MINFEYSSISDRGLTPPGNSYLTLKSSNLKGRADCSIYVPRIAEGVQDIPVVILLHGVYGSHWCWQYQIGADRVLDELITSGKIPPMALVMPSDGLWGDGSAYLDHGSVNYESWICQDVVAGVQHFINEISTKSPFFIAGLSMGGYGAMSLGSRHPSVFQAFSGLSAITDIVDYRTFTEEGANNISENPASRFKSLIDSISNQKNLRPFRFDCGTEDQLLESNRRLHQQLKGFQIPHDYQEFDGGHDRAYWTKHLEATLAFFAKYI